MNYRIWRLKKSRSYKECITGNYKKNLEKFEIRFNEENVVILTKFKIPFYLKVIASFGPKFCYAVLKNDVPQFEMFMCMAKVQNQCNDFAESYFTKKQLDALKDDLCDGTLEEQRFTYAQLYIRDLMLLSRRFLRINKDIFMIPADKGGRVVIMDKSAYYRKMNEHINESMKSHVYYHCRKFTFIQARERVEKSYNDLVSVMNPFLEKDVKDSKRNCCTQLRFEPYVIPLLYGYPKPHKEGIPMRPIVSSINSIGKDLSFWLLRKLQKMAKNFSKYDASDASSIIKEIENFQLEVDHHLVTWDYKSMFTNIPIYDAIAIIKEFYYLIEGDTCVPVELFIQAVKFFTIESTYFGYNNRIYRQCSGLAMGNCLSQVLAEMTTNRALLRAVAEFSPERISLIYKFVDDIMAAVHKDHIEELESSISNKLNKMVLNRTDEDQTHAVVFLDCKFRRTEDKKSLSYQWFKRPFSSLQVLNYHSNHPKATKSNVIKQMAKTALVLTAPECRNEALTLLKTVLRNSSYPQSFFENIIETEINAITHKAKRCEMTGNYIACPFYLPFTNRINGVLRNNNLSTNLGHRLILSNKRSIFNRLKDKKQVGSTIHSRFTISCNVCSFESILYADQLDVTRTISHHLNAKGSKINDHLIDFPTHHMNAKPLRLKAFASKYELTMSKGIKMSRISK